MEIDNVIDEENEILDPRIKIELENLNLCSDNINKLSKELQKAREKFDGNKRKARNMVTKLYKSVGPQNINLSKRYYELLQDIEKGKCMLHKSTTNYSNLQSHWEVVKKKVDNFENKLLQQHNKVDVELLDNLNNANKQLMKIKKEMLEEEKEHSTMTNKMFTMEKELAEEMNNHSNHIILSKPFYQLKKELEKKLKAERQNAEDLHLALVCQQQKYKMALLSLENISNEEHMRRKLMTTMMMGVRTPGVGAEQNLDEDNNEEINISSHLSNAGDDDDNEEVDDNDSAFSDYDLQRTINNLIITQQRLQSTIIENNSTLDKSKITPIMATSKLPTTTPLITPPDPLVTHLSTFQLAREAIDGAESFAVPYESKLHQGHGRNLSIVSNTELSDKFSLVQLSDNKSNKTKHFSISTSDPLVLKNQMWNSALNSTAELKSGVYTAGICNVLNNKAPYGVQTPTTTNQLTFLNPMLLQDNATKSSNISNKKSLSTSSTSLLNSYF